MTTAQIVLVMSPFAGLFVVMAVGFTRQHMKDAGLI